MIDRESILSNEEILKLIRSKTSPVAIDQWYTRKQQDREGEFYRKLVSQRGDHLPNTTTQGFYLASPSGKLLGFCNNRDPEKFSAFLNSSLQKFSAEKTSKIPTGPEQRDLEWIYRLPPGGFVGQVHAKVLGGYPKDDSPHPYTVAMRKAVSVDSFWATSEERSALQKGIFPTTIARRLARYHFVDTTRGEPPMWKAEEVEQCGFHLAQDGTVTGAVSMRSQDGTRGYRAAVRGHIKFTGEQLSEFTIVAKGRYWGEGVHTKNAPEGEFPLAVVVQLASPKSRATQIVPQGAKGWLKGYLEAK